MAEIKEKLLYTKDHEWVETKSDQAIRMGISDFAQASLGDITFVELPEIGKVVAKGDSIASVESVKAVSDIYAPMSGKVSAINEVLEENPELLNSSPYEDAWLIEIECSNSEEKKELLKANDYANHAQ